MTPCQNGFIIRSSNNQTPAAAGLTLAHGPAQEDAMSDREFYEIALAIMLEDDSLTAEEIEELTHIMLAE